MPLPDYMIPSSIVVMEKLPVAQNGKINLGALPVPGSERPELDAPFTPPRTDLEKKLARIWSEVLGIERIGIHDSFLDLGGDSLRAVSVFSQIEKRFGRRPIARLLAAPTIAELAVELENKSADQSYDSVIILQGHGSLPPFFIVAGLASLYLHPFAHALGPEQPVYGLEFPGMDGQREPFSRIEDLAADLIRQIRQVQPRGPYHLGGHSTGGLVAYEIAQQLTAAGELVKALAIFDALAFGSKKKPPLLRRLRLHARKLWHLDWKEKVSHLAFGASAIKDRLTGRYIDPLHARMGSSLSAAHTRVKLARRQAVSHYRPKPYPGRVIIFQADQVPAPFDIWNPSDPSFGWGKFAMGGVDVREVPGTHMTMFDHPNVLTLVENLRSYLNET